MVLSGFINSAVNAKAENQFFKIVDFPLTEEVSSREAHETVVATGQALPSTTPLPTHSELASSAPTNNIEKSRKRQKGNPLHWFGILVPPDLRNAQATCRLGIEEDLSEMASTAIEMRRMEDEIERLRQLTVKAEK